MARASTRLRRAVQSIWRVKNFFLQVAGNVRQPRRQPERDQIKQPAPPPPLDLFDT